MQIRSVDAMKDALLEMAKLDGSIDKAAAKRNQAIAKANAAYDEAVRADVDRRQELERGVEAFAAKNEGKVCEDGKRSLELAYARVAYKTTPPKLDLMPDWSWNMAVDAIKRSLTPAQRKLALKVTESVDKTGLKKLDLDIDKLAEIGCVVTTETTVSITTYPDKVAA
ncbi:MAG: host-nuclease inhibitor Gam family protein [Acidobacteria bacterium]|nr:host-nuclease inhibitor Gam family protein [Acidobacteriota bacterium]